MSAAEILEQIRRLPPEERNEVFEKLVEEFGDADEQLTREEIAELERRADELEKHPETGVSWEQVRAELSELTPVKIAELEHRSEEALKYPERGRPVDEVIKEVEKKYGMDRATPRKSANL